MRDYGAAVARGDWERARSCWLPAELASAARLGIRYRDVPIKIDSASPLLLRREELAKGAISARVGPATVNGARAQVGVVVGTGADTVVVTYHLARTAAGWRLVSLTSALAGDWPVRETAFLRLHEQPPRCLPQAAIDRLDGMAEQVCRALGATPARVGLLRREKIDYFHADPAMVEALALGPTAGVALLQNDAVVTGEPCHLHELAHLLVNFCAGELGLFASPLLQEGVAVHFGGRWGRAPEALREMSSHALRTQLLTLDDLLIWDGFHRNPADLTYAPAGLVAGQLLKRLGAEPFLELYRESSGTLSQVQSATVGQVQSQLAVALGTPFAAFAADLSRGVREPAAGALEPGPPGEGLAGGDTIAIVGSPDLRVGITRKGEWIAFDVESTARAAAGTLLLGRRDGATDGCVGGTSRLFAQHLPGLPYRGEVAAIIFDPQEVGLYDFDCDLLLAKHVEEFQPTAGFASDDGRRLRFRIRSALLPDVSERLIWRLEKQAEP